MTKGKRQMIPLAVAGLLVLELLALMTGVGAGMGASDAHADGSATTTSLSLDVPLVLAITNNTPVVTVNAENLNTFYTGTASVTATTNNPTGYTLTMANNDTDTDLVNGDYDSSVAGGYEGVIESITSEITVDGTGSNFTVNKWGYAKDSAPTVYKPIPQSTAAEEVKKTTGSGSSGTTVSFGTKVNGNLVAGSYEDTVVFSLTANAVPPADITKLTSMQQLAEYPQACTNSAVGTIKTNLPDERDDQTYTIAKLADGKCWMLDNLALDLTDSEILSGMDSDNTNASNTTLNYLRGTSTRDPSTDPNGNYATAGVSNWTSSYSYSAPLVNLTNKDIIPSDATSQAGQYKVGGYYNYCAATAGSYCYGNGTSQGTSSGNATEDICPKGWRLPSGNTSGEFSALAYEIYGSTGSTSDPTAYVNYRAALHLPLSGYFNNGSPKNQGSNGSWWSSTRNGDYDYTYILRADTSYIVPANINSRDYGGSVRCIASS